MIKVIDNCLHPDIFNDLCMIAKDVPYSFLTNTAYNDAEDTTSFSSLYSVEALATNDESNRVLEKEPLGMATFTIVKNAVLNANVPFQGISRLRFAILHRSNNTVNAPHVDATLPHKVGLIYLNDSDGETVFYNEKVNWEAMAEPNHIEAQFKQPVTVAQKVKPKANRMVLFEGNQLHSSTNPVINDYRMVLNFNYV